MQNANDPNLAMLELVVGRLGGLVDELVFLGGSATGRLLTDASAPPVRVTKDVDVIAEVASLSDYYTLAERLRSRGFVEDHSEDAPICRWTGGGVILDVMPSNPDVLGFGNEWYRPALDAAEPIELPSGKRIRLVSGPFFLATKLAAFDGRGGGDYLISHDIEDMVAVLDGRPEIVEETIAADEQLRQHLAQRFTALLADKRFLAALHGHLPADPVSQRRVDILLERLNAIAGAS